MTDYNMPLNATRRFHIPPQKVQFEGGPLDGSIDSICLVHEIDGQQAVVSFHGEGFYALRDAGPVQRDSVLPAMWFPHRDARFQWARYV